MPEPLVSLVMSVYNGEKYLEEAVESILNQTFHDFEFIIINDGSTDSSGEILKRYEISDNRIKLYHQENSGLIPALNKACRLAKGKYIARMDDDDISLPERFSRQIEYLESHPEIGILDTWIEHIDENGVAFGHHRPPTSPTVIKWLFFFGNPTRQSSLMTRRDVMESLNFYSMDEFEVEDYDLLARSLAITKISIIPEILSKVRYYKGSRYRTDITKKWARVYKIMNSLISGLLNRDVPAELVRDLYHISREPYPEDLGRIYEIAELIDELRETFVKKNPLSPKEHEEIQLDVGDKYLDLAKCAWRISIYHGAKLALKALTLNPSLLFTRIIKNGAKIITRKVTG